MQSWNGPSHNASPDEHGQWQSTFGFAGQDNQFDPGQAWSQPLQDQSGAYSHHISPQDASTSNYFTSTQGDSFLPGHLRGAPAPTGQSGFHGGHDALSMGTQYAQPGQDMVDPGFSNINPELYGQQGKIGLGDGMGRIPQAQNHPHAHSQAQAFGQQDYSFAPQNEQSYEAPAQQFGQPHLMPQQSRQQSHTPVQQFDNLHNGFAQSHGFARPPQHSPAQPQQQPQVQQQQQFSQAQVYGHPQANGQHKPRYQPTPQPNFQHQQQQQQHPQSYSHPNYPLQKPLAYPQQAQSPATQILPRQQPNLPASQPSPAAASVAYPASQHGSRVDLAAGGGSASTEPAPKKRKRVTKSAAEAAAAEPAAHQAIDLTGDVAGKKQEEIDALVAPVPTSEETQLINKLAKRSKTAQAKQPSIRGLPHLVYDGSVKLPAPKGYDKLSPFVALPSRSGKPMVPELGCSLPCEVQGKFTSLYRPSADKIGLDERRAEAKALLDGYDESMKALGKRRPKYTEYPHAFKEQLKSDEATKNKAGKKAKKELEEAGAKPIRTATRPTDLVEAAVWDVIGFVHIEKAMEKTNALIAGRVQQVGDLLIYLRSEANRAKLELDQATKDKEPEEELRRIKTEWEQKKEALYKALDAAIEHADDRVLDNMGGHQKLVTSLVNALIACIKASDFSGKLPKIVLELFTQIRMTKKIAETTNFDTVRKRFAEKGDDEVKELVREISARVKKVTKASEPETATGYTGTSAASRAKSSAKPAADSSSAKRSREDDTDPRTVKKIAVESGGSSLSKKLAQPKAGAAKPAAGSSVLPGKSRPVAKSVPKPEVTKADSPAGSGDDKAKVEAQKPKAEAPKPKAEAKPPAPKMAPAPSSSALSGIASLLDSINAPKAEPVAPTPKEPKESETPETPEEKAKRLRKEARRKLRVSWKPEGELVQVQVFHKDDEEDEGREINMIRDAADDRSEGMVLKQRANVEEDDEDDDIPYQPWFPPNATDFTHIADDVREKNYVTRGGNVNFTTGEQQRITEREQRELMAIYTDPNDIPSTPRSPPPEMSAAGQDVKVAHLPTEGAPYREIQSRWRDSRLMGPDAALFAAVKRLGQQHSSSNKLDSILGRLNRGSGASSQTSQQPSTAGPSTPSTYSSVPLAAGPGAEELLLAWLASDKVKTWWDSQPTKPAGLGAHHYADPETQAVGNAIEEVAKVLLGKPYPATSPPQWIAGDEERVREWWLGYNKEAAIRQRKTDEERARAEAQAQDWSAYYAQQQQQHHHQHQQQQQQQQYAPYMALVQQMAGGGGSQQSAPAVANSSGQAPQIPDNQLQSILAAINQPGQQQQQPPQAPQPQQQHQQQEGGYLNPNDPSYQQYLMLAQMAQQGQQGPGSAPSGHEPERDWDRDRDWEDQQHGGNKDYGGKGKKKGSLPPHKPANKALIGTKPCTFWQQGKCARGDKCTFRHD